MEKKNIVSRTIFLLLEKKGFEQFFSSKQGKEQCKLIIIKQLIGSCGQKSI